MKHRSRFRNRRKRHGLAAAEAGYGGRMVREQTVTFAAAIEQTHANPYPNQSQALCPMELRREDISLSSLLRQQATYWQSIVKQK